MRFRFSPVSIPLIILTVFFLIGWNVDKVKGYDITLATLCMAQQRGSTADALFIGSSRMAASLDPLFLEEHARATSGQSINVDRLTSHGPDLVFLNAMAREYLSRKSAPTYVFIEVMHTVRTTVEFHRAHHQRDMVPYLSASGRLLIKPGIYIDITSTPPFDQAKLFFHRDYTNIVELLTDRYISAFYRFIQEPGKSTQKRLEECSQAPEDRSKREALYQDKIKRLARTATEIPSEKDLVKNRFPSFEALSVPREPGAKHRDYENASLRAISQLFIEAGVKNIFLVVIPSYGETEISNADRADIAAIAPMAKAIYLTDMYLDNPALKELYSDPFHYSQTASLLISDRYLRILTKKDD